MTDYSPAGVAHIEQIYQQIAQDCVDRTGQDFLANVGTASTARDMDVVRAALGENQINYLGYSYGTELGAKYAEQYPDRVRAMVLDGAVDPGSDPIGENIRQLAGFQTAFDDYAADCARSVDCPLGQDPTQFVARYHQLVDPLVQQPGRTSDPRGLSYSGRDHRHRQRALHAALLEVPDQWAARPAARHRRRRPAACWPTTTRGATRPGTTPTSRTRSPRSAASTRRTRPTPRCGPTPTAGRARPRRSWPTASSPGSRRATSARCGRCPRRRCRTTSTSPGPGKVVVVSTTHDPATPYQAGVDLARELDASLITFDGTQHTVVFNGDACVDPAVVELPGRLDVSRRQTCSVSWTLPRKWRSPVRSTTVDRINDARKSQQPAQGEGRPHGRGHSRRRRRPLLP